MINIDNEMARDGWRKGDPIWLTRVLASHGGSPLRGPGYVMATVGRTYVDRGV